MSTVQSGGEGFRAHIKDLCEAKNLHQEADELGDDADFYDDLATWQALGQDEEGVSSQLECLREQAIQLRRKAEHLVSQNSSKIA